MPGRSEILNAIKDYDSKKHSEEFYDFCLGKISKAVEPDEQLESAVRHLFYWFLGKVHIAGNSPIESVKAGDTLYHISEAAPSNKAGIEEAVKKANLWAGLAFRNNSLPFENFQNYAKSITSGSIVMPAFFIHIFKPYEYPILNDRVWAAYRDELGKSVFTNTKPASWDNYMEYSGYCSYLKRKFDLTLRQIDKGLWVIGDRCKERARNTEKMEADEDAGQVGLFN
ncbi:MAG: hypothetical protein JXB33_04120 [Clostridia bacterium]|nr:hypothetical protein [Clostridia bacterium]